MREPSTSSEALLENLISNTPPNERCPHLKEDLEGPYCSKNLKSDKISQERRMVCDSYSLQLWCLNKEACQNCIWYKGEKFRESPA